MRTHSLCKQRIHSKSQITLSQKSSLQLLKDIHQNHRRLWQAVSHCLKPLSSLIDSRLNYFKNGGRLFYVGAGTSGKIGCLDASECLETFGDSPKVDSILAGGARAWNGFVGDVEDNTESAAEDISKKNLTKQDLVVGISASGTTAYTLEALHKAKTAQAATTLIDCATPQNNPCQYIDFYINCRVGEEFLYGATRLKAATAQKLIVNYLSTTLMIRLGKTYGHWMIGLRPMNKKSRKRACSIVSQITQVPESTAKEILEQTNYSIKDALLIAQKTNY